MKATSLLFSFLLLTSLWATRAQELRQLTDLPSLYVTTTDHSPVENKFDYVECQIFRVEDDIITTYDGGSIRGRGNSTWTLDKKPYRLRFKQKKRFLGANRANAKSWVLLANHSDKSMLRNAVASYIGEFLGMPFVAGSEFVDLVLNGRHRSVNIDCRHTPRILYSHLAPGRRAGSVATLPQTLTCRDL